MCCFAKPVLAVANTRLFARLTGYGQQQLVYQMEYASEIPNAMILPLPVALPSSDDRVRFVSLKDYGDFFGDLDRGFPDLQDSLPFMISRAVPTNANAGSLLQVHEIGDFVASFVPTVDDFNRLDPQFVIPKESWDKLPGYHDFGFAVFQLKQLQGEAHPIAFEFDTRWPDQIFFPTVHIHDGEVHSTEDFDHSLYLQHSAFDAHAGRYKGPHHRELPTGFVRSQTTADKFCRTAATHGIVDPGLLVHRLSMQGNLPNIDVIRDVSPAAVENWPRVRSNLWPSDIRTLSPAALSATALAVAGLGFGWLIHRRMKLSKPKHRSN